MKHGSSIYGVKRGVGSSTEEGIRGSHIYVECQAREEDIPSRGSVSKGSVPTFRCLILTN